MKKTNKITVREVFNETKSYHFGFSSQLLYFALATILSLLLAYVVPFSLVFTFPFIIVPSYFGFSTTTTVKCKDKPEPVGFFFMFKSYFNNIFFGGYRLIAGFFKSLLAYVLTNTLVLTILDIAVFSKSSEFQNFIKTVQETGDVNALEETLNQFTDTLLNSPDFQKWVYLSMSISLLVAFIIYIQHIMKHSIKMRRNLFTKQIIPTKQFNFVDKRVRKDNRKLLFATYCRTCWFAQLAILLAGAGGIVGSFFLLKEYAPQQSLIISIFLMLVVALPFMNYINKLQDIIYFKLSRQYEETFATLTLEFLTKYKEKIGIAEEDAKKIEEILNAQKENNKEENSEENKDLEDK